MVENDIYDSETKYRRFLANLDSYLKPPHLVKRHHNSRRKYWIKNKANKKYFLRLGKKFESRDISYIRRIRLFRVFMIVCYVTKKDLKDLKKREKIDEIVAFAHKVNKSVKSKRDFAIDIKFLWKLLFPEKDEKGRPDETQVPYVVRHLSGKVDKSKEKLRGDKFSLDEFERLIQGFGDDPRMQALLTVSFESLGRPQELLARKIRDVELHDGYAKIYISEHGKEGTGFLRVIDSYFYLTKWLNTHPLKKDKNAYLFINTGRVNRYQQLKPMAANKLIRDRCKKLDIDKPITMYSLKRNAVTMMRLTGQSDLDIQHRARWKSTKQLHTYDLSGQEESFKIELIKRGIIKSDDKKHNQYKPTTKLCAFCGATNGLAETMCYNCNRPLDREAIDKEINERDNQIKSLQQQIQELRDLILPDIQTEIKAKLQAQKTSF